MKIKIFFISSLVFLFSISCKKRSQGGMQNTDTSLSLVSEDQTTQPIDPQNIQNIVVATNSSSGAVAPGASDIIDRIRGYAFLKQDPTKNLTVSKVTQASANSSSELVSINGNQVKVNYTNAGGQTPLLTYLPTDNSKTTIYDYSLLQGNDLTNFPNNAQSEFKTYGIVYKNFSNGANGPDFIVLRNDGSFLSYKDYGGAITLTKLDANYKLDSTKFTPLSNP